MVKYTNSTDIQLGLHQSYVILLASLSCKAEYIDKHWLSIVGRTHKTCSTKNQNTSRYFLNHLGASIRELHDLTYVLSIPLWQPTVFDLMSLQWLNGNFRGSVLVQLRVNMMFYNA